MIGLNPGQVFRFSDEDRLELLLWIGPNNSGGWFIDINAASAAPIYRNAAEVADLMAEKLLAENDDLDEFTTIIILAVLYYNTEHLLTGYSRDPQMIADGVNAIPIELWEWGIQRRTGMQRSYPEELVRLSLPPLDDATLTARGIRFYGCYFSYSRAIEEHWFEKARAKRSWKLPISYEPRDMNRIWLRDPPTGARHSPRAMNARVSRMW